MRSPECRFGRATPCLAAGRRPRGRVRHQLRGYDHEMVRRPVQERQAQGHQRGDDKQRLSYATYFHGDVFATNPLNPSGPRQGDCWGASDQEIPHSVLAPQGGHFQDRRPGLSEGSEPWNRYRSSGIGCRLFLRVHFALGRSAIFCAPVELL